MLLDCGHEGSLYGMDSEGKRCCYACCAERDKAQMIKDGQTTLYLTDKGITNWPGSLVFPVQSQRTGRHNIAGKRYDVWFTGPEGKPWHGVQFGDMTQLCHCKRLK